MQPGDDNNHNHDDEMDRLASKLRHTNLVGAQNEATTEQDPNSLISDFLSMSAGETLGTIKAQWQQDEDSDYYGEILQDNSLSAQHARFSTRATNMIRERRLIVTEKGHMGLAPWYVREGFKLAILRGCSVPVLLEYVDETTAEHIKGIKIRQGDGTLLDAAFRGTRAGWHFRGDCFVQGWMEGETIRGYGQTTDEAWGEMDGPESELRIY